MQASVSITYWLPPAEIALTGHSDSQAPQFTQRLVIEYAMGGHLLDIFGAYVMFLYIIVQQNQKNYKTFFKIFSRNFWVKPSVLGGINFLRSETRRMPSFSSVTQL